MKGLLLGIAYVSAAWLGVAINTSGQDVMPVRRDRIAVVYTGERCGPCKVYKAEAIDPLRREGYRFEFRDVDAEKLAKRWTPNLIPFTAIYDLSAKRYVEKVEGKLSKQQLRALLEN